MASSITPLLLCLSLWMFLSADAGHIKRLRRGENAQCKWAGRTYAKGEQIDQGQFIYECGSDSEGDPQIQPVGCKTEDGVIHKNGETYRSGKFYSVCIITPGANGGTIREDLAACAGKDGVEHKLGDTWVEGRGAAGTKVQCKGDATHLQVVPVGLGM